MNFFKISMVTLLTAIPLVSPLSVFAFPFSGEDAERLNALESQLRQTSEQTAKLGVKYSQLQERLNQIEGRIDEINYNLSDLKKTLETSNLSSLETQDARNKIDSLNSEAASLKSEVEAERKNSLDLRQPSLNKVNGEAPVISSTASDKVENDTNPFGASAEYESAFTAIRKGDYDKAEADLQNFVNKYPNDSLTSSGYYWLAEVKYLKNDYSAASNYFLKSYDAEPKGSKASLSLYKLALSLGQLKKYPHACVTLKKLITEFPDSDKALVSKAKESQKEFSCGK